MFLQLKSHRGKGFPHRWTPLNPVLLSRLVETCIYTAMDDEGMAEIRSLGELHHMVWNDTMSLVTSAWWFNCLKNMEHDAHEVKTEDGTCHDDIFDELIDFPIWLNDAHETTTA
ncbi:hypothetical protein VNO78_29103 [Psophocarpus tetragonolobus]|uniref:Uncharacterized protein n=1 Tax=Psophocarpus tetragonolobus TaxID=3891 RepID=A0AAN9RUS2_PSOTE